MSYCVSPVRRYTQVCSSFVILTWRCLLQINSLAYLFTTVKSFIVKAQQEQKKLHLKAFNLAFFYFKAFTREALIFYTYPRARLIIFGGLIYLHILLKLWINFHLIFLIRSTAGAKVMKHFFPRHRCSEQTNCPANISA
jgi:hypothetical protein